MKSWVSGLRYAAAFAACTAPLPAFAHGPVAAEKADDLAQLVGQSNLVVMSQVASVEYRTARNPDGGLAIPHAVVTFRIAKALRGKPTADTLVLLFPGGPDGQGRFFQIDGIPLFQPGDQDVLFVSSNGGKGCALVLCEYGRYRVLDGRVFDTHGSPVRAIVKDGAIARGEPPKALTSFRYPAPTFDGLLKNPEVQADLKRMGMRIEDARKRYEAGAPKEMELATPFVGRSPNTDGDDSKGDPPAKGPLPHEPLALDTFMGKIGELVQRTTRAPVAIRNFDPKAEIVLTPATYTKPGAAPPGSKPPAVRPTPAETAELRALQAQDFNPVLKR